MQIRSDKGCIEAYRGMWEDEDSYSTANEADMLNVVLFGKTAKQWKDEHPSVKGNMRDAATLNQLLVLANLESKRRTESWRIK